MMSRFLRCVLCAGVVLAAAGSARACLNDREVNRAEREFRSQYQDPSPLESAPTAPPTSFGDEVKFYAPLTFGGLLLVGAFMQTARRRDNRA
jgi:hypothetical protein